METVNALLNLPGYAGSSERALAVSELLKQNDSIQAARYEAEDRLSYLRSETAALFTETLSAARGVTDEDALKDAADMWREDSVQAAAAFMGADIVTAANPWGCNQYGHRKGHQGGTLGRSSEKKELSMSEANTAFKQSEKEYADARKKVWDLEDDIENATKSGDSEKVNKLKREQEKARAEWKKKKEAFEKAKEDYNNSARKRLREKKGS